jgi:LPXTG-motif cell wall-anchored protein
MHKIRILAAAIVTAAACLSLASPAAAGDDLNCGDPGTSPNMSVPPGDPDGLDADGDGIGCDDDDSENTPTPTTVVAEPAPTTTEAPGQIDELPRTGTSSNVPLVAGGVLLLALGGGALVVKKRLLA